MSVLLQYRAQGRFLKFQVNSTYGAFGGLQFIGLTGRNIASPGYKPGYKDKLSNNVAKYSYCRLDDDSKADVDNRQIEHCQKLSYIVEGKTISTRCPGNCACCKSGAKTKTVVIREGEVPVINVLDRSWNDDSISSKLHLTLPSGVNIGEIVFIFKISSRNDIMDRLCVFGP